MKKTISILGGGACALMLGCELDPEKYEVTIYERNAALGRKFLVAGDGGLNITHSENPEVFLKRYTPSLFLEKSFKYFTNKDLIAWLNEIGIKTYVGSSGRVFPLKEIKPVTVLNTIIEKIKNNSAALKYKHEWKGFSDDGGLLLLYNEKEIKIKSDIVIFCLGGASWPVTGSKGDWGNYFENMGVSVIPFHASNCSYEVDWKSEFISRTEGKALKNISITCGNKTNPGEVVLTKFGIEGSGIYPLSPLLRDELASKNAATIAIDFKPNVPLKTILEKLAKTPGKNVTDVLKSDLNLSPVSIHLLKSYVSKENFLNPEKLSDHIKSFQIKIISAAPVDDAISTVGGICLKETTEFFELKKLSKHYAIGEMLDYDAPTGGYLLQSCFTMANFLAGHLNKTS